VNPLQAVESVLVAAPGALCVSSLGTATSALRAASDDGPHLYMGGAMGSALAVAIGVAEKAKERDVVAILGDGETLMGAGSLWSLAGLQPPNLLVAILSDGHYSITGGQELGVRGAFSDVARSLGIEAAVAENDAAIMENVRLLPRPALLEIRCDDRAWPGPSPFVDPPVVRWRFESAALTKTD
jgi:thiamine pyrophosphate-dependent acetolactate synthase large subunit-like protein